MSEIRELRKDLYISYLEEKVEFLEKQVSSIIDRYDKGGTLIVFPEYEEWMKPTTPLSERNHPMV